MPEPIRADALWHVRAYRLALFLQDLSWSDVTKLLRDRRTIGVTDQLYRAVGAIGSDIAEGFSRSTGKDRARFYEYALGSAREGRNWYYASRQVLGARVAAHRLDLLSQIIRLLLTMLPAQRKVGRIRSPRPAE